MKRDPISLEPLADYLRPQFGNVYDYNFKVEGQFDVQDWTDDLQQAVKYYMLNKAPEDLRDQVIDQLAPPTRDTESQKQQIDSIIAAYQPWEIAHAFHEAAIIAVPTLHALIGQIDHWHWEDDRMDASTWLEENATDDQLKETARAGDMSLPATHQELLHNDPVEALVRVLEPPDLIAAWNEAVGPAPSDLTDDEWELLVPLLPKPFKFSPYPASWLPITRSSLNGIFYRLTSRVRWSQVPRRYGVWQNVYQRWYNYKNKGVFRRMHQDLHDKPEAKRIAQWLQVLDTDTRT